MTSLSYRGKNRQKFRLRRLGGITRERFKQKLGIFSDLSETIGPTNVPDATSLAVFGMLQNANKYCTKVFKQVRPEKESKISANV